MEVIIEEVVGILQRNGGSMQYTPLYDAVSDNAKRQLYPALRQMKRNKQAVLTNPVNPETKRAVFVITLAESGGA